MPNWQTDGNPNIDANSFLGTRAADPLRIRTCASVNNADVMTITPAPTATTTGKVGIGTPTPETKLHVRAGRLRISESDGTQASGVLELSNGTKTNYVFTDGPTGHLHVRTDSATHHVLLQTGGTQGNVGIGTTVPGARLDVTGGGLAARRGWGNWLELWKTDVTPNTAWVFHTPSPAGSNPTPRRLELGYFDGANWQWGRFVVSEAGNVGIGTTVPGAKLHVTGDVQVTGDIRLMGADCAEDFDVAEAEDIEPGTVMVIDEQGAVKRSQQAYDKRVAGVVSGAGEYRSGIILDKRDGQAHRMSVALMGKVACKVDAQYSPIEVGDLLTTSPTPGHAMKADDPHSAFGSVIGKALRPLKGDRGIIPILAALQ